MDTWYSKSNCVVGVVKFRNNSHVADDIEYPTKKQTNHADVRGGRGLEENEEDGWRGRAASGGDWGELGV